MADRALRLAVFAPLLLAACGFVDELRLREAPPGAQSWRLGYADGCQSGRQSARGHRPEDKEQDRERFRADDDYRTGWQQGHDDCFARTRSEDSAPPPPAATPVPAVAVAAPAAPAPVAAPPLPPAAAPSAAARRAEIERRLQELRREMNALETELESLGP